MIIICPQDATAAAAAADEANAAGVKVISYDRLILDTDAVDYYVTFDSISVGKAQAQYLVDKATGTGNPLYLYAGAASDNNAFLFFEGAWERCSPRSPTAPSSSRTPAKRSPCRARPPSPATKRPRSSVRSPPTGSSTWPRTWLRPT